MPSTTYPNFPELLKKLMDRRQFEQTGKIDRSVFEIRRNAAKLRGGFDWDITPEGKNWIRWIYDFDFSHFHTYIEERKGQYAFLFEEEKDNNQLILEKVNAIENDFHDRNCALINMGRECDCGLTEKINELKQLLK